MKKAGIAPLEISYRRYTVRNMSMEKTGIIRLGGIGLATAGLGLIWLQAQPPKQPLEVQKVTDEAVRRVDEVLKTKEHEIMQV